MEKFIIVAISIFTLYHMVGKCTVLWARFAAGIEILGYFDDGSYDPSEKAFKIALKRLEHERRVQKGWILGISIMLITMTSGVLVSITELNQVIRACLSLFGVAAFAIVILLVAEQILADVLRKRLVSRYQNKLAEMPHQF